MSITYFSIGGGESNRYSFWKTASRSSAGISYSCVNVPSDIARRCVGKFNGGCGPVIASIIWRSS